MEQSWKVRFNGEKKEKEWNGKEQTDNQEQ